MSIAAWSEYDNAADWCAARGLKGKIGDPLPTNLSRNALELINEDPEAFEDRVRMCAYARAMEANEAGRTAAPKPATTMTQAHEQELVAAVEQLLDAAKNRLHHAPSDETFTECYLCRCFEGHAPDCAVPLLEKWMEG